MIMDWPYIPLLNVWRLLREQAEFLIAFDPENKNFVEKLFGKGEQAGASSSITQRLKMWEI